MRNAPTVQNNVAHYTTTIAVKNEDLLLEHGMTAEVAIITAEVGDAVRVRNTALRARLPDGLRPPDPPGGPTESGRAVGSDGHTRS